jgi:hypothetical protein
MRGRTAALLAALLFAMVSLGSPAMAWHQHEIVHTHPAIDQERVLHQFRCEPAHISQRPHPMHFGLHAAVDPDVVAERGDPGPITVRRAGDCS